MSIKNEFEARIASMENKVYGAKNRTASARLQHKLSNLIRVASEATDSEKDKIQQGLDVVAGKLASDLYPSLEEVEKEIDAIYGNQSQNSTYYFSRGKKASGSSDIDLDVMSLEDMEAVVDAIYGDQSKNDTYYFSRGKRASSEDRLATTPLGLVVGFVKEAVSGQSKNDHFYFSRKRQEKDADYYEPVEMTPQDMFALEGDEHPASYDKDAATPIPAYYALDNALDMDGDLVDVPSHEDFMEDLGFGHNIRTKVEEAPHIREALPVWDSKQSSIYDELIKLGSEEPQLQSDIKKVLDVITKK